MIKLSIKKYTSHDDNAYNILVLILNMKFVDGDNISRYASSEVYKTANEKTKEFAKSSGCSPLVWWSLLGQYMRVLNVLNQDIKGKSILDLGCGSNGGTEEKIKYGSLYEPWFSRFVYQNIQELKLNIFGIDKGDLEREEFPHMQLNLLEEKALINNFKKNSFDIITAFRLFNSPELEKETYNRIEYNASKESSDKLMNILSWQIKEILKPEGIFLYYGVGEEVSPNKNINKLLPVL